MPFFAYAPTSILTSICVASTQSDNKFHTLIKIITAKSPLHDQTDPNKEGADRTRHLICLKLNLVNLLLQGIYKKSYAYQKPKIHAYLLRCRSIFSITSRPVIFCSQIKPSKFTMRHLLKSVFLLSAVSFALLPSPVFADDATDAGKLLRAGQLPEAMQKVDAVLAQRPKDAQMRFLKGLILAEQNKNPEAITIFTKLTDDYPELPEPYNNLAVLYASSGQYDKARTALEMAIRTNPTYGTAHENLGDIYAKLASQAYDKALQLDSANSGAKLKLTLVKSLIGNTTGGSNPKTALPVATVATQANNQNPVSKLPAAPAVVAKTEASSAKVAANKVEMQTPKAEAKPATKTPTANTDQSDILKATEDWAKAWSSKDTNAYLAHYAKDFQTPKNESRKAWAEERRARIEGKGRINVKIEAPKVTIDGHTASVKFRQIYSSDQLTANSRKSLEMAKQDGKWLIKAERTGN